MAPVLIRELRRRAALNGEKSALFFTKAIVAQPFSSVVFYTRPLNLPKVVGTGFVRPPADVKIEDLAESYKCKKLEEIKVDGRLRAMEEKDVGKVTELLTQYLK